MAKIIDTTTGPKAGNHAAKRAAPAERRLRQVPAVERAIAILRLLGRTEEPMGVNQIARSLGIIPSTCLHILRLLVEEELVDFDALTKHYRLGVGILPLARSVLRRNRFNELIQPALDHLTERFGITTMAVQVVMARHMVVVAISRAKQPFHFHVDVGSRFPALLSATGRCFAAFGNLSDTELEKQFPSLRWDNPPTFETWRAEVAEVRRRGYSVDEGDYIQGATVVSVPVFDGHQVMTHAIVAVGMQAQLSRSMVKHLIAEMRRAASDVSGQLDDGVDA